MEKSEILSGKAYIITGPTSGIGYASVIELARHSCSCWTK